MMREKFLYIWLTCLVCFCLNPSSIHAVNLGGAYKPKPGYGLKLYTLYYNADIRTDKNGHSTVNDLGLNKTGISIGNCYQIGDLQLNANIPVSNIEIKKLHERAAGLGDILLSAGWFLPVKWANILPTVAVKTPTGNFDKRHSANTGDGQTDLLMGVYFFKLMQPLSYDAVVKYNVRFRNPDNDITPGNEFSAEGLVTLRLLEGVRIGPAINFTIGGDNKKGGKTLADSGVMRLSAGGEVYYGSLDNVKVSLAAYKDMLTNNSSEGIMVLSRVVFVF